ADLRDRKRLLCRPSDHKTSGIGQRIRGENDFPENPLAMPIRLAVVDRAQRPVEAPYISCRRVKRSEPGRGRPQAEKRPERRRRMRRQSRRETMKDRNEQTTKAWVLALASLASFMISLDSQVVTLALSTIRLDLGASIEQLEWIVNAYIL